MLGKLLRISFEISQSIAASESIVSGKRVANFSKRSGFGPPLETASL